MLDLQVKLGLSEAGTIWTVVAFIAVVGSAYAVFGGLRAVAVSDTFNGLGLLVGGFSNYVLLFCLRCWRKCVFLYNNFQYQER